MNAADLLEHLETMRRLDPQATQSLLESRADCTPGPEGRHPLEESPSFVVGDLDGRTVIGLLGVLNGLIHAEGQCIEAIYQDDVLLRFRLRGVLETATMRFTERASRVVFQARSEAHRLGHRAVSTGHLLLGLLHEGKISHGVGGRVLLDSGVRHDAVLAQLERLPGRPNPALSPPPDLSPRLKRLLSEVQERFPKETVLGTEHLAYVLVQDRTHVAGCLLFLLGVRVPPLLERLEEYVPGLEGRAERQERVSERIRERVDDLLADLQSLRQLLDSDEDARVHLERIWDQMGYLTHQTHQDTEESRCSLLSLRVRQDLLAPSCGEPVVLARHPAGTLSLLASGVRRVAVVGLGMVTADDPSLVRERLEFQEHALRDAAHAEQLDTLSRG